LCAGLGLSSPLPANAEKVGVAAAVNPDAFSSLSQTPNKQLKIGKSIFYNERINTTASGLVQVLLVDGSTFTVGPNSNLVIDKFVYNPKKKSGEVVATFSKGAMRFVGGKLSKNDGGVRVKTPAGALAIRGGIVQAAFGNGKGIISFVYGDYAQLKLRNGKVLTAYQPGNTIDITTGRIRPTTAADINLIASALSKGETTRGGSQSNSGNSKAFQLADVNSAELINDAAATNITGQILQQLKNDQQLPTTKTASNNPTTQPINNQPQPPTEPPEPPVEPPEPPAEPPEPPAAGGGFAGYAAALDRRTGKDNYNLISGFLSGESPENSLFTLSLQNGDIVGINFSDGQATQEAIFAWQNGTSVQVINGSASMGSRLQLPEELSFLDAGRWSTGTIIYDDQNAPGNANLDMIGGWWITGTATAVVDLPQTGTATYNGTALGTVADRLNGGNWVVRDNVQGNLVMNWDFAQRRGDLAINNFDGRSYSTGPNELLQPSLDINQFGGALSQTAGPSIGAMTGQATGSFVNRGSTAAGGVMGNWGVRGNAYRATGIFGGARVPE
jgi:hypothetical protein